MALLLAVELVLGMALATEPPRPDPSALPVLHHPIGASLRLIVVGDIGVVHEASPAPCSADVSSCTLSIAERDQLWATIAREGSDAIFVTGDLVYGPDALQSAPKCRTPSPELRKALLDPALGDKVRPMGVPVYLSLGNHDVAHRARSRARERCLLAYAASEETLVLPQLNYVVDFGLARLTVLNTNLPTRRWNTDALREARSPVGWDLMGGHHVIHTHFDKEHEHEIRDWLVEEDMRPDLFLNGHAHFFQFGVYDGIAAVTSGSGAKLRVRPVCPGDACDGPDAPRYAASAFGYSVVDVSESALRVSFRSIGGEELYCTTRKSDSQDWMPCAAAGAESP